jgi:hypothetical protein
MIHAVLAVLMLYAPLVVETPSHERNWLAGRAYWSVARAGETIG